MRKKLIAGMASAALIASIGAPSYEGVGMMGSLSEDKRRSLIDIVVSFYNMSHEEAEKLSDSKLQQLADQAKTEAGFK